MTELGDLKRSQSKFDEAINYYTQAQQFGPLKFETAYGLAACYISKQEYPPAVEWSQKAVALAPDSAAGRFVLGNALFQNGQFEKAIPELKASLQMDPGMTRAYFFLGLAYSKLDRPEESKRPSKKLDEFNRPEAQKSEPG